MNRRTFLGGILGAGGAAALPEIKAPELPKNVPCSECDGHGFVCVSSGPKRDFSFSSGVMPTVWPARRTTIQVPCPRCSK